MPDNITERMQTDFGQSDFEYCKKNTVRFSRHSIRLTLRRAGFKSLLNHRSLLGIGNDRLVLDYPIYLGNPTRVAYVRSISVAHQ